MCIQLCNFVGSESHRDNDSEGGVDVVMCMCVCTEVGWGHVAGIC